MNQRIRLRSISLAILLALLIAATLPISAFADEGEPPPAPTGEVPAEEAPVSEEATDTSGEGESPAGDVVEASDSSELPEEEVASPAESDSLLSEIPDGTEVIILDETGEAVPLASEEALEILVTGDPIWCPVGVAPVALTGGCSNTYLTLQALLAGGYVPTTNSVIWIQGGADTSAVPLVINGGTTYAAAAPFTLTLKGGWDGVSGSMVTSSLTPSTFTQRIQILNWQNDVTLSDISIDAGNVIGLFVTTTKNINLTRVSSNNNTGGASGGGANLDNSGGTGNVTVTGGTFNSNSNVGGLTVISKGNITLNGVTANNNFGASFGISLNNTSGTGNITLTNIIANSNLGNAGLLVYSNGTIIITSLNADSNGAQGANIHNETAATAKNVTVSGTNSFFGNNNEGIYVASKGMVTLSGISSQSNGDTGILVVNNTGTAGVTISNSTASSNGTPGGIFIDTKGTITLNTVTANSNTGYGAFLDNDAGTGGLSITNSYFNSNTGIFGGVFATIKGAITLNGVHAEVNTGGGGVTLDNVAGTSPLTIMSSTFNSNAFNGIQAYSHGAITLTSVIANSNSNYGAKLEHSLSITPVNVTVNGLNNQFNSNTGANGLDIATNGTISVSNVTASSNIGHGVYLDAIAGTGAVTVNTTTANLNGQQGVYVNAKGNITISGITANQNTFGGSTLTNTAGTGNVSASGTFNQNVNNANLTVLSKGTITLTNVTANQHSSNSGAVLDNSTASSAKTVTLNGTNEFSNNDAHGLTIASTGAVTINNISASDNGLGGFGHGVFIDNTYGTTAAAVTLNGTNIFTDNNSNGLQIDSEGAVKLNNILANSNDDYGTTVTNTSAATPQSVTITGTNQFKFNGQGGLVVYSDGAITASSITANSNGPALANGAYLDNAGLGNTAGITLTGTNVFNDNGWIGLNVHSRGPISVSSVTAIGNGITGLVGSGAYLENISATTHVGVTVSGVNYFDGNYDAGLSIATHGAIVLNSVTAINSVTDQGALIDNTQGGFTNSNMPVTINGTNNFSNNYYDGLEINSYGAVTLNNVTAQENGITGAGFGNGVYIANQSADTPKTVTINGVNNISDNQDTGLYVSTKGLIKINSLTANGNGSNLAEHGAYLQNNGAGATAGITLTGTNTFNNNFTSGMLVFTNGPVSLNNITANSNQNSYGVVINNTFGGLSSPQNVTVTGTNQFNTNDETGLGIITYGMISLNNITANGNGVGLSVGYGVNAINSGADSLLPLKGITLTGTNQFNDNFSQGLVLGSLGKISANNVTANNNGNASESGVEINNSTAPTPQDVVFTGTNVMTGNTHRGLWILTDGTVTLSNITANDNDYNGLEVHNESGPNKNITLTGTNTFSGNDNIGAYLYSTGVISLNNATANDNMSYGFNFDNLTVNTLARAVTLTGINTASNNNSDGLHVLASGPINVSNLTANDNNSYGAYLNNAGTTGIQSVTLTGATKANGNLAGINIITHGAVSSTTGITASNNSSSYGLQINNTSGNGTAVTLNGTNIFIDNYNSGLIVVSEGAITVSNVTATGNGIGGSAGFGAYFDNDGDVAHVSNVTISGTNNFSGNYSGGLSAFSLGAISVNSATASNNTLGIGVELDNDLGEGKSVTITGTNVFNGNFSNGLVIYSHGAITMNNITANENALVPGQSGAYITNVGSAVPQFVKLNGNNTFNGNGAYGLDLTSDGAITTNNLTVNDNATYGAFIANDGFAAVGGITMTGVNSFLNNGGTGLGLSSWGSITLSKITADGNTGDGLNVASDGNITLTCGTFSNNSGVGLFANALGILTLKGVTSSGNAGGDYNLVYGGSLIVVRTC